MEKHNKIYFCVRLAQRNKRQYQDDYNRKLSLMSLNSFGHMYKVTTWGESHGPSLGATIDGCPPGIDIDQNKLQVWMDKRKPGQSKYTTQRKEPDSVEILSGVFEGVSTGTPIQLITVSYTHLTLPTILLV